MNRYLTIVLATSLLCSGPVLAANPGRSASGVIASSNASNPGTAPATPAESTATPIPYRNSKLPMRQLGAYRPIELRGIDASQTLPLNIRLDEVVASARLRLNYTLSPSLIAHLSHLKVYLNDEVQSVIVNPKEKLGTAQSTEVEIDPRYFVDFNRLRLQFIGHYTEECEFPHHSSLWAQISNDSELQLQLRPLALPDDLTPFPAPFFDARDSRRLILPFIFAPQPDAGTLRAAGSLASWFGQQASYRGSRFPVHLDTLPEGHAILFAVNGERPAGLNLPQVDGPTISIMNHPTQPYAKLLLVLGRNGEDLKLAADALALGKATLSGRSIAVRQLDYPGARQPYDAPLWVPTGRPVKLGELVQHPNELQTRGARLGAIRINARFPPDIFTWHSDGIPIDLKYRYTPHRLDNEANLTVSVNERFVQAFRLAPDGDRSNRNKLTLPLIDDPSVVAQSDLNIPAFQVGSNNQLQFHFNLPQHEEGKCRAPNIYDLEAAIDPSSTLDLTHFYHYTALPNLAYFANSGYPFTKYADLAQTTVVLPDVPSAYEIEAMLSMLGKMSASTGYPALAFRLLPQSQLDQAGDSDLLVIAGGNGNSQLQNWGKGLPALLEQGRRTFTPLTKLENRFYDWFGWHESRPEPVAGRAILDGDGPLAAMTGFESPYKAGRSILLINATTPSALPMISKALDDPGLIDRIHGDLVLLRGEELESFRVNDVYYVGDLPWWRWLWFHLHRHPLLMSLAAVGAGLLLALLAFAALKGLSRRRLNQQGD